MGKLPLRKTPALRPLDESEIQRVRDLVEAFTQKGGDRGFLFFAWSLASMEAKFFVSRSRIAGEMLLGPWKSHKKAILASATKLLNFDNLVQHDRGRGVLRAATREDLESLVARAKGEVEFEGFPDRHFVRKGSPLVHHMRYCLVPALITHLDAVGCSRSWTWDWLTRWCEVVESVSVDWPKESGGGLPHPLARGNSAALERIYQGLRVIEFKKLNQSVESWWLETAVGASDEVRVRLMGKGLLAYSDWIPQCSVREKEIKRRVEQHAAVVKKFVRKFGLAVRFSYPKTSRRNAPK